MFAGDGIVRLKTGGGIWDGRNFNGGMRDKNYLQVGGFAILTGGIYSFEIDGGMQDVNLRKSRKMRGTLRGDQRPGAGSGIIILSEVGWRD